MAAVSGWMWEPQAGGCGDVDVCAKLPVRNVMETVWERITVKYWLASLPKASSFPGRNSRCSVVVEHFAVLQLAGSAGYPVSGPGPAKPASSAQPAAAILALRSSFLFLTC
jgi:hypothetical protein